MKKENDNFNLEEIDRKTSQEKCDRCGKKLTLTFYGIKDTFPGNSEERLICKKCGEQFHKFWIKYKV